jgi:hypothetical protein
MSDAQLIAMLQMFGALGICLFCVLGLFIGRIIWICVAMELRERWERKHPIHGPPAPPTAFPEGVMSPGSAASACVGAVMGACLLL